MMMAAVMVVVILVVVIMVVVIVADEEVRFDVEDAVEIKGSTLEHIGERDVAFLRAMKGRVRINGPNARLNLPQFRRADEIGLIEDNDVGEGDLVLRLGRVAQALGEPFGVGDRNHGVEPRSLFHVLVDEEGLRHRRRIGEARRLDDDRVEPPLALHQPLDDADEVAAHGAADAAVVHFEHLFVSADDELVVDADLAELVHDDRVALAMRFAQNAVEQGRLAGAQIAGKDGDGNFLQLVAHGHALISLVRKGSRCHISSSGAYG